MSTAAASQYCGALATQAQCVDSQTQRVSGSPALSDTHSWEVQRPWFCFWIYNHKQEVPASQSHRATSSFCLLGGVEPNSQRQSCTSVCCSCIHFAAVTPALLLLLLPLFAFFWNTVNLPSNRLIEKLSLSHLRSLKISVKLVGTHRSHEQRSGKAGESTVCGDGHIASLKASKQFQQKHRVTSQWMKQCFVMVLKETVKRCCSDNKGFQSHYHTLLFCQVSFSPFSFLLML